MPGFHRGPALPDDFALQVQFGERLHLLVRGHVQELLPVLVADFQTVSAALELLTERPHIAALGVKHEDRRMLGQVLATFVDDVQKPVTVDRHVVRGLPGEFGRQLGPIVDDLVPMIS